MLLDKTFLIKKYRDLKYLTKIDLGHNKITSIDKDTFSGLNKLTQIHLNNNEITSIDQYTFNGLENLTYIWLSHNQVTSIDKEAFIGLKNLSKIDLSNNQIKSIDKDTFGGLNNLTYIWLGRNQISSIGRDTFSGLNKLTKIDLGYNQIRSIDKDTFSGLENLIEIHLSYNEITSIDKDTFNGLNKLAYIWFSHNQVTSIDKDTFSSLNNLTKIDLGHNKIRSINKDTFSGLNNLTKLHLNHNQIRSINKDTFSGLNYLTHIYLNGNYIRNDLIEINLHKNPFKDRSDPESWSIKQFSQLPIIPTENKPETSSKMMSEKELEKRPNSPTVKPEFTHSNTDKKQVMISYNTKSRDICVNLKQKLEDDGFSVWIDFESMGGSSLESMARAIENSYCVLICATQKYSESKNCQLEAEYVIRNKKFFIPLILEKGYKPTGWLGIMFGTIYVDLTKFELSVAYKEIKRLLDIDENTK